MDYALECARAHEEEAAREMRMPAVDSVERAEADGHAWVSYQRARVWWVCALMAMLGDE